MNIPVMAAEKLKAEGMAWRDVAQELAWAKGRKFAFDSIQNACYAARKPLRLPVRHGSTVYDGVMLALWDLRIDTKRIAELMRIEEGQVANRLSLLREMRA